MIVAEENSKVDDMSLRAGNLGKRRQILYRLKSCIAGYCRTSNLHGFRNIAAENVKCYESLFWIIVCMGGTLMTVIMFSLVWERFQKSPTMTTIETNNYPIKNVPFPAVTVCNLNKILKSSFEKMAEKFEEHGINKSNLSLFLKQLPQIYSTGYVTFEHEDDFVKVMRDLGYTLESFMFDLSQPCSQYLVRCLWLGIEYKCSELFVEMKTPEGFCCSFNWHGRKVKKYNNTFIREIWDGESVFERNKYIFVEDASTSLAGLTVVLDADENNFFASVNSFFGSVVIVHNSFQYPDSDSSRAFVQSRSEAMITLRANIIESSKSVRSLKIHQRQCYFDGEHSTRKKKYYTYEACSLECKLSVYSEMCGCIPFYYPNITNIRPCELSDLKCLSKNRVLASQDTGTATIDWDYDSSHVKCRCLPSCNDINYEIFIQGNDIRSPEYASPTFQGYLGNRSAVSVYFEQNVCMKYRIDSAITWESVIASFGGIFGLCLGGSIISLIELLYYFLYDRGSSTGKASTEIGRRKAFASRRDWKIKPFCVSNKIENRLNTGLYYSSYQNGGLR